MNGVEKPIAHDRPRGFRAALDLVATLVMLAAGVAILVLASRFYLSHPSQPPVTRGEIPIPKEPVSIAGAPQQGNPMAAVVMIIHSDFQCPYCGRFARETLPELISGYVQTGRVLLVFRNNPLPTHQLALPAAVSAECAGRQGQFWQAHDLLFSDQSNSAALEAHISSLPAALRLDQAQFSQCLGGDGKTSVRADKALSDSLSLSSTPGFLLGTAQKDGRVRIVRTIRGAQPASEFGKALDSVMEQVAK